MLLQENPVLNSTTPVQWARVPNCEDLYEISSEGEVRRVPTGKVLKPSTRSGYLYVCLSIHGKVQRHNVHRLVAAAFVPNPLNKPLVNHINGNKLTNTASNLEWCNHSENHQHAYAMGLKDPLKARPPIGSNRGTSSKYMYVTYFKNDREEKYIACINARGFSKTKCFSVRKYGDVAERLAAKAANDLIDQYPEFADRPKNVVDKLPNDYPERE